MPIRTVLVNGAVSDRIGIDNRGLQYGDGVFRTLRLICGKPALWPRHYAKLQHDCHSLFIDCPPESLLLEEISKLAEIEPTGVIKIIVTRPPGKRGYTPLMNSTGSDRLVSVHSYVPPSKENYSRGIKAHICNMRLSIQPRLAGIKHLNRLENVLAAAELDKQEALEGVMLDTEGYVVEGTRSNLFACIEGELWTSGLKRCGVSGIQRERVLEWAEEHGVPYRLVDFTIDDMLRADEIFLVNSVFGLWPVREMTGYYKSVFPVSERIRSWLSNE